MCSYKIDLNEVNIYLCLQILNKKNKVLSMSTLAGKTVLLYSLNLTMTRKHYLKSKKD